MRPIAIIFLLLSTACVSKDPTRDPSNTTNKQLLGTRDAVQTEKYYSNTNPGKVNTPGVASEKVAQESDAVAVFLPGEKTKYVQKPSRSYKISSAKDKAELEALQIYVDSYKPNLGVAANATLKMKVDSVQKRGERTFVKFSQFVEREVGGAKYIVPVVGSTVVVTLKKNEVISMLSAITNPPSIGIVFQNPGFDLSKVSGKELELLRTHMQNYGKTELVKKYFANVAANTGLKFDFDAWMKANPSAQMQMVREFFANIKKTSTAKMLIDLARMKRLSYVKRNGNWNLQVSQAFGLPLEFDLEIPKTSSEKLMMKNIRDMNRQVTIEVHSSPAFPLAGTLVSRDDEVRTGVKTDHVTSIFQDILGYFREMHGWEGPSGSNKNFLAQVHKDISIGNYMENAFWSGSRQLFGIGAGGSRLQNLDKSYSVLGHEYAHAMVEYTSGLVYQGQSGALNEHIADVQGVQVEAYMTGQPYSYVVGSDIVSPEAAAPRKVIVDLILMANKVPEAEIQQFNMRKMGLRNMYQPAVSLSAQPSTIEEGLSMGFGPNCEPSENNDYCGVHYMSGVPNRATSLLIARYGENHVRGLLFNTAFYRLHAMSDFSEYLRQMYEECMMNNQMSQGVCDYVVAAFQSVGVEMPNGNPSTPAPHIPAPQDQQPLPEPQQPQSPPLKMCGWISISASRNITIIDNKYDTVILNSENAPKFGGNFTTISPSDFNTFKHKDCGCVTGTISQTPNSKNVWFNYFLEVQPGSAIKHKTTNGCKSIEFK